MAKKSYRVITPDRYLSVREEPGRVTVRAGEEVVARSARAVWLKEGERPDVLYVPRDDVAAQCLVTSGTVYECRWKGQARYFHVDLVDRTLEDVVWGYPDAPDGIAALRERVSFDTSAFAVDVDASVPDDAFGAGQAVSAAATRRGSFDGDVDGRAPPGESDGGGLHRNAATSRRGSAPGTEHEA